MSSSRQNIYTSETMLKEKAFSFRKQAAKTDSFDGLWDLFVQDTAASKARGQSIAVDSTWSDFQSYSFKNQNSNEAILDLVLTPITKSIKDGSTKSYTSVMDIIRMNVAMAAAMTMLDKAERDGKTRKLRKEINDFMSNYDHSIDMPEMSTAPHRKEDVVRLATMLSYAVSGRAVNPLDDKCISKLTYLLMLCYTRDELDSLIDEANNDIKEFITFKVDLIATMIAEYRRVSNLQANELEQRQQELFGVKGPFNVMNRQADPQQMISTNVDVNKGAESAVAMITLYSLITCYLMSPEFPIVMHTIGALPLTWRKIYEKSLGLCALFIANLLHKYPNSILTDQIFLSYSLRLPWDRSALAFLARHNKSGKIKYSLPGEIELADRESGGITGQMWSEDSAARRICYKHANEWIPDNTEKLTNSPVFDKSILDRGAEVLYLKIIPRMMRLGYIVTGAVCDTEMETITRCESPHLIVWADTEGKVAPARFAESRYTVMTPGTNDNEFYDEDNCDVSDVVALALRRSLSLLARKQPNRKKRITNTRQADAKSDEEIEALKEEIESLKSENQTLRNKYTFDTAKEEEYRKSGKEAAHQIKMLEKQIETLKQEVEDEKTQRIEYEAIVNDIKPADIPEVLESAIPMPYHTKHRILSVGGHATWLKVMRQLLPDVEFIVPTNGNNSATQRIANCDAVFIKNNCISHPHYWAVVEAAKANNIPFFYFDAVSHIRNAQELAKWDSEN